MKEGYAEGGKSGGRAYANLQLRGTRNRKIILSSTRVLEAIIDYPFHPYCLTETARFILYNARFLLSQVTYECLDPLELGVPSGNET